MTSHQTPMVTRIVMLSGVLALGAFYAGTALQGENVPPRAPLAHFPVAIEGWTGRDAEPFTPEIVNVLGVDDYINRIYRSDRHAASLYIGYHESQRQGDAIHSPLNCLPGSGWEPVSRSYLDIPVAGAALQGTRHITVNRYVVQKGLEQWVVLYWYHGHGRVVANEYRGKLLMVYDAVRLNRTDASLVRVMSRRIGSGPEAEAAAGTRAAAFVKAMFPLLDRYLPA